MSGAILGCTFTPNRAQEQVVQQITYVNSNVDATLGTALDIAQQLASYRVPNLTFDVPLAPPDAYTLKDAGDPPDFDPVDVDAPGDLPQSPGNATAPAPARPSFTLPSPPPDAPTPTFTTPPVTYQPSFPAQPTLLDPDVPTYGDHTNDIPIPTPRAITLPTAPDIDLSGIQFQGVRPTFQGTPPDPNAFNYTETPYDPLMVDQLKSKILSMIAGSDGITPIVEFQLWSREAEREEEQEMRAEQEVLDLWAGRGFGMPVGMVNASLEAARQNSQNQRNTKSRDVAIRTQDVLLDQLKFAVGQGVALEELWVRVWTSTQDRKLQAAKMAVDIVIQIYNANVAMLQAEAEVYKVDADVYRQLIEAELAKLQVYSEELKAQQLIASLNQQDIDLYLARLKGVETNTAIYTAEIEARNSVLRGEQLKLEQVRAAIDQELAKLQASDQQLRAWTALLQGEQIKQQSWAVRAQTYTAQVQALSLIHI